MGGGEGEGVLHRLDEEVAAAAAFFAATTLVSRTGCPWASCRHVFLPGRTDSPELARRRTRFLPGVKESSA